MTHSTPNARSPVSPRLGCLLGDRRARASAHYIAALGIASERLVPSSVGEEHATGHDEPSRALDRRAELRIHP